MLEMTPLDSPHLKIFIKKIFSDVKENQWTSAPAAWSGAAVLIFWRAVRSTTKKYPSLDP